MLGAVRCDEAIDRGVERASTGSRFLPEWPHFQSAGLIEMVLAKADGRIAAERPPARASGAARHRCRAQSGLRGDSRRARVRMPSCSSPPPVIRRSIDVRTYVDPLNLVQIELLKRVRRQPDVRARRALMVTVNGIAAGMRNTG
jgi:phosphoenolpyruvate carboxylase